MLLGSLQRANTFPLWAWIPPLTPLRAFAWLTLAVLAAVAVMVGLFPRPAALTVSLATWFAFVWEQQTYSNHFMLTGWLMLWLAFSRSDTAWSLTPRPARSAVRLEHQFLLMTQLSVCYFFAAVVKVNERFLSGAYLGDLLTWPLAPGLLQLMAVGTILVELGLATALWHRRLMVPTAWLGLGLHVLIPLGMQPRLPLVAFSLTCLSLYPMFLFRHRLVRQPDIRVSAAAPLQA